MSFTKFDPLMMPHSYGVGTISLSGFRHSSMWADPCGNIRDSLSGRSIGRIDAFGHIRKIITLRLKVSLITFPADAVQTDPDAVQADIKELCHKIRSAGIGVHVNGTAGSFATDLGDGRCNDIGCQQGLAFTTLAKADHAVFYPPDVFKGHLRDL